MLLEEVSARNQASEKERYVGRVDAFFRPDSSGFRRSASTRRRSDPACGGARVNSGYPRLVSQTRQGGEKAPAAWEE